MKKIISCVFLVVVFLIFACVNYKKPERYKVLEVVEADLIYLDVNSNDKKDEDELFKIMGVNSFYPIKNENSYFYSKKLGIDEFDFLKLGYIARAWAKKELTGKRVEVLDIIKNNKKYGYIKIKYNFSDYATVLLLHGLAFVEDGNQNASYYQYENLAKIHTNIKNLSKLDFSMVNLKTFVYHKLSCEYTKHLHLGEIKLTKDVNNSKYFPCKVCSKISDNKQYKNDFQLIYTKNKYLKSLYKNFGDVELFLINPLEFTKPSSQARTKLAKRLISEINGAKKSIDIALYGFGEQDEVYRALQNAKSRGVKIRAVVDYSKNSDEIYPKTKDFINEFEVKQDNISSFMHNKFFIFDNKKVLSGSVNISSTGIGGYNANLAVMFNLPNIAKIYTDEFNQMYNGNFSIKKEKLNKTQAKNIEIYFSPKDSISDEIIKYIKSANDEIFVSAFYLTDRILISELIEARKRGVNVLVLADSVFANNFKDRIYTLRKANIATIIENWGGKNHEKTIVIDSKILISGSCNFSRSGFNKNDENVILIKNPEIAKFYRDYYLYLFNSIDKKFLYKIPRAEGFESVNSCNDGIDNNFDGKIDSDDDGCKIK